MAQAPGQACYGAVSKALPASTKGVQGQTWVQTACHSGRHGPGPRRKPPLEQLLKKTHQQFAEKQQSRINVHGSDVRKVRTLTPDPNPLLGSTA